MTEIPGCCTDLEKKKKKRFEERSPLWILNIGSFTKIDGIFKGYLSIFKVEKAPLHRSSVQAAYHNPNLLYVYC